MRLEGKVCLITGGAMGIGRASAELFLREGARIAIADWDRETGEKTAESLRNSGGDAIFTHGDVGLAGDARRMVQETVNAFGKLDVLMNNAAVMAHGTVLDTAEEEWDRVLRINLKSVFLMSKYAIPHMIENGGGAIINVSSAAGITAWENQCAYDAAKAGVVNLSRQMALDFIEHKIRVNCLVPALVDTPQLRGALGKTPDPEAAEQAFKPFLPIGRLGTAEEIAQGALFLASDESSFVVGSPLLVDGGFLAH
ncbi:MAG: SDR family NAD(P)-dependent oxidoreductase [Chloroflexota bacterium]